MDTTKLVLFDFDGTISDSHHAAVETYNSLSHKYGFRSVQPQELEELKNISSRELLKRLGIPLVKLPLVVREARLRFEKQIDSLQPYEGIQSCLMELKKLGLNLCILTSNSRTNVLKFLKANSLELFDDVYTGASIFGKSRVIKSVLKKRNISAAQAVYVGDETRDIEAAKAAGIRVISVTWGFHSKEVLGNQRPDFLIDRPSQLSEVLTSCARITACGGGAHTP